MKVDDDELKTHLKTGTIIERIWPGHEHLPQENQAYQYQWQTEFSSETKRKQEMITKTNNAASSEDYAPPSDTTSTPPRPVPPRSISAPNRFPPPLPDVSITFSPTHPSRINNVSLFAQTP